MIRSYNFLFLTILVLFFVGCSSSQELLNTSKNNSFKTSKKFCTSTSNLRHYSSRQLHNILLNYAKNDILFDFLDNNSATNNSYDELAILNLIKIKNQRFEMNDEFTDYCLEIDAEISNIRALHDEMILEDYCINYNQKNL